MKNDRVSLDAAKDDYGVVLDPATMKVDQDQTVKLRKERGLEANG